MNVSLNDRATVFLGALIEGCSRQLWSPIDVFYPLIPVSPAFRSAPWARAHFRNSRNTDETKRHGRNEEKEKKLRKFIVSSTPLLTSLAFGRASIRRAHRRNRCVCVNVHSVYRARFVSFLHWHRHRPPARRRHVLAQSAAERLASTDDSDAERERAAEEASTSDDAVSNMSCYAYDLEKDE